MRKGERSVSVADATTIHLAVRTSERIEHLSFRHDPARPLNSSVQAGHFAYATPFYQPHHLAAPRRTSPHHPLHFSQAAVSAHYAVNTVALKVPVHATPIEEAEDPFGELTKK